MRRSDDDPRTRFWLRPPTAIEAGAEVGHYAIIYSSDSIMGALVLTPLMLRYWGPKEGMEAKEGPEGADQG